jgi:hypothetical protein
MGLSGDPDNQSLIESSELDYLAFGSATDGSLTIGFAASEASAGMSVVAFGDSSTVPAVLLPPAKSALAPATISKTAPVKAASLFICNLLLHWIC